MTGLKNVEIALAVGLIIAILLSAAAAFGEECAELREGVLRLHILANSDEPRDQQIKLEIRDAILHEYGDKLCRAGTKEQAQRKTKELLGAMEETARCVVEKCGRSDNVHAEVVTMYFNMRSYGELTMPAGYYDAVRITVGEAKGHNWWCVLYPPICIPAAANTDMLSETVAGVSPDMEPRFALVEWFEQTAKWWRARKNGTENLVVDNQER